MTWTAPLRLRLVALFKSNLPLPLFRIDDRLTVTLALFAATADVPRVPVDSVHVSRGHHHATQTFLDAAHVPFDVASGV